MRLRIRYLILLLSLIFSTLAFGTNLRSNKGISGTSQLNLTEKNLSALAARTADLPNAARHFLKRKVSVGSSEKFYTYNFETEKYEDIDAILMVAESNVRIWVENNELENGHVNTEVVNRILENLISKTPDASIDPGKGILQIIHENFGSPPDIDEDGISEFLITDIIDGWQEGEGFIAGYFNPLDQFINGTRLGSRIISGSNERDLLYIDSSPGIYHNQIYRYEQVLATMSHEYQHLVQFNYDQNEETFLNEGLSELSSYFCGYGLRDPSLYLLNSNLGMTQWDSDINEALKHYAKTALWTYYLYEKYGKDFIRSIARSELNGIASIDNALGMSGIAKEIEDVVTEFLIAITINDTDVNPMYGFTLLELVNLKARAVKKINSFPAQIVVKQNAFALNLFTIKNGSHLIINVEDYPAGTVFKLNKFNDRDEILLESVNRGKLIDPDFGDMWPLEQVMSINPTNNQGFLSIQIQADQTYHIALYDIIQDEPDLKIAIDQNIIANQFFVPYDSCILSSIRFYKGTGSKVANLYIYHNPLNLGSISEYEKLTISGVLSNGWNEVDVQSLDIIKNAGDSFDIGLEYVEAGNAGYVSQSYSGISSYMKNPADANYLDLSQFKADGQVLKGTWMMDITYAAPLHLKPDSDNDQPLSFSIDQSGPSPFPTPGNLVFTILYTISQPGNLNVTIYDILGRKVAVLFKGYKSGPAGFLQWDGKNELGSDVASGSYYLRFQYENQSDHRKIIVIR